MVKYVLTYFPNRNIAEVTRQMFHLANVPFEDKRISKDTFSSLKHTLPFEQVPILEVDGHVIPQSIAIIRYVAKELGFYGETLFEQALVDAIADQFKDYSVEIKPYLYRVRGLIPGTTEEIEVLKNELLFPARDRFLRYMTDYLTKSSTGYIAGGDLTFADLILAEHISVMRAFLPEYTFNFSEINDHQERVHAIPNLKKWIETRPHTSF